MKCFVNSTPPSYYCFYFWRNTAHHPMGISGCSKIKMPCSRLGERLSPSTLVWRPSLLDWVSVQVLSCLFRGQSSSCTMSGSPFSVLTAFGWVKMERGQRRCWEDSPPGSSSHSLTSSTQDLLITQSFSSSYLPSLSPQVFFSFFSEPRASFRIGTNSKSWLNSLSFPPSVPVTFSVETLALAEQTPSSSLS